MLTVGNLFFNAERRLFKFDRDVFPQIGATLRASSSSRTGPAEEVAEPEEFAEDVAEILKDAGIEARPGGANAAHTGVSIAVINGALFGICQHRVGFADFLKSFLRIRVIGIAVWMVLERQLAVCTLELGLGYRASNAENLVVIAFCVCGQKWLNLVK